MATASERKLICAMMCEVISRTSVSTSARLSSQLHQHGWLGSLRTTCPTRHPGERFLLFSPCSTHSSIAEQRKIYNQKSFQFSVVKSFVATASERKFICAMFRQVISRTSVFTSARLSSELDQHWFQTTNQKGKISFLEKKRTSEVEVLVVV